jgi:hypothetical protein
MSGPTDALRAACSVIRRGVSRKGINQVLVKRDHLASGWETGMNNIFWIIGVIVVVLAVLSFLGLR